jgi:hypothetical protein
LRRSQYVPSGTVLTTRKATADMRPLLYKLPDGRQAKLGVVAVPAALDINHGWYPKNLGAAAARGQYLAVGQADPGTLDWAGGGPVAAAA